ncbi:MAG TPA: hypothetical protein VFA66_07305 [Gaiellaceae bacterium]|nr:hypothetical protein [Gaiellaceae bacterium]
MTHRPRSTCFVALLAALAALSTVLAFSASAAPKTSEATAPCGGVAKGAPWSYKGEKGTAYSAVGVNGASCALGLKYLPRWTRDRATFDLKPVPAGWHCSAIGDYSALAKLGQCTTTKGGIFEWLPKRKK